MLKENPVMVPLVITEGHAKVNAKTCTAFKCTAHKYTAFNFQLCVLTFVDVQ